MGAAPVSIRSVFLGGRGGAKACRSIHARSFFFFFAFFPLFPFLFLSFFPCFFSGDMVKGDEFMLATDAARLLGKTMQQLFQMFPGLMRRQALPAERAILQDRGILRRACNLATLVYAREIDLLVTGNEQAHALRLHPELVKKPVRGAMYELVHASHVPQAAPCTHTRLASRFTNVLAPNFRRKYGMASKSDELPVRLAPIRLSLDYEQQRIREIFCWNLSDTSVPMAQFAQQLCRDLEVTEEFVPLIVESIEGQIIEFTTVAQVPIPPRLATIHLEVSSNNNNKKKKKKRVNPVSHTHTFFLVHFLCISFHTFITSFSLGRCCLWTSFYGLTMRPTSLRSNLPRSCAPRSAWAWSLGLSLRTPSASSSSSTAKSTKQANTSKQTKKKGRR